MQLALDNCLPAAILRFGSTSHNEVTFTCHLDSCAAMNTTNLKLHQWIVTTYPTIVASFEQFDNANPFHPIGLNCAVPSANANAITNKLTAVVIYKTWYTDIDNKPVTLSFGLGKAITVNAIIGFPTFKKW